MADVWALALSGLLFAPLSGLGAQPRITVEPSDLDLGVMLQNQTSEHRLVIRNDGDAVLHIREVQSDCGCTIARTSKDQLSPGESTYLDVVFDSQNFYGPLTKVISIHSNDPVDSVAEVALRVDIHTPVLVTPGNRQLLFGQVRRGHQAYEQAFFETADVAKLEIKPQRYDGRLFTIEVNHAFGGDPTKAELRVQPRSDAPPGTHRDIIRLATNVPDMPTIDLEATITIVSDLTLDKDAIKFRFVEPEQELSQEVRVSTSAEEISFQVIGAEIDLPHFAAEVQQTIPDKEALIRITGRSLPTSDPAAQQANGRIMGTLRIFTDQPSQPELQVKVSYLLRM